MTYTLFRSSKCSSILIVGSIPDGAGTMVLMDFHSNSFDTLITHEPGLLLDGTPIYAVLVSITGVCVLFSWCETLSRRFQYAEFSEGRAKSVARLR